VTAEIANITYSEFLPNLAGKNALTPYDGYDPNVDPHLSLEFVAAAFRFGHSIVSGETEGLAENGEVITGSEEDLKDVFFQPAANFNDNGGGRRTIAPLGRRSVTGARCAHRRRPA
jgi:hypothetical protein